MDVLQVSGMYSEENTSFKHRYPIRAIALDPRYGQRKTREFVTGGDSGELVLHSRVGCSLGASWCTDFRGLLSLAHVSDLLRSVNAKQICIWLRLPCGCVLQGWLGIKDTVLHSGEGAIRCVRWSASLIAWANAVSVKASEFQRLKPGPHFGA